MISDAKWKSSRIAFDLATAFMDGNGRISLDDAIIIAATPAVVVDFDRSPDSDLSILMQEMKRFLKSHSRFRSFTKDAISNGLRLEWLPQLEDEDKLRLLSDIKLIQNVTDDGYVVANPELLAKLTSSPHPDREKYGVESYSPTPVKKSSSSPKAKTILTSVEPDINLAAKLKPYIEWYKRYWTELQSLEGYKWRALNKFTDNFNFDAEDFSAMWNSLFNSDFNLLATGSFYNPLGGIKKIAKHAPEETREMFRKLFYGDKSLAHRIDDFMNTFDEIYNRLVEEDKIKMGGYDRQSERAISVYLAFQDPAAYYIYKPSVRWDFVSQTDISYPSLLLFESKLSGYNLICEQIRDVLMRDGELLSLLNDSHPEDISEGHLLTQDFIYCVGIHFVDFNSQPRYYQVKE